MNLEPRTREKQILRCAQDDIGRDRASSGVTLLELLVVVALASILLAIVFPAVGSGLGTLELQSAAVRVAAAARYARDQAVYRQRTFQLRIDSQAGSLAVEDLEGGGQRDYQFPPSVRVAAVLSVCVMAGARMVIIPVAG